MPDNDLKKKRISRSHGKRKNGNIKRKIFTEKRINTSLKDPSITLNNHGRHCFLSFLSSLSISAIGPKHRFLSKTDFPKCRREIAASLNDFSNRWCKLEDVEPYALKEWRFNIFRNIDTCI